MAKPQKIKNKNGKFSYRIFVNHNGKRESRSFSTRQLAIDWAEKRQRELDNAEVYGEVSTLTLRDVLEQYINQFAGQYGRTKQYELARLMHSDIANVRVNKLTPKALINHCVERNKEAKPSTVRLDLVWLRVALKTMSAVNGFDYDPQVFETAQTVLRSEKLVSQSKARERMPTKAEMWKLTRYFKSRRSTIPMSDIMWFAYFSARRQSEITRLVWSDNNDDRKTGMVRDAKHPTEKKGNHRRFKYEASAWKIAQRQPRTDERIFPYNHRSISLAFIGACKLLGINDLHFHDLRHAATTRLFSKGYSIEQVQQFTLHEEWKTLSRYTHIKPEDID